ncbi:hypothetical protein E3V08_06760 [Candidatus Atribacteria bacterium MT.SAG.1]|nr:hypothetical protein E3V08_06760 [Candidatus Atribacteria bacterium MT.SAG.1]
MIKLLTGNEAVAEGIIESGAEIICGYFGALSTKVIQILFFIFIDLKRDSKDIFEKLLKKGYNYSTRRNLGLSKLHPTYYRNCL